MIEFQNVSKIFKTKECEVKALENVSLTIEDGDIYGIIGFSGRKRGCIISGGNIDDEKTAKILLDEFKNGVLGKITIEKADSKN